MLENFNEPEWLKNITHGSLVSFFWALVGRAMFHAKLVQQGRRRVFSLALIWELPIALGMYMVGAGVADALGSTGHIRDGIIVSCAYLGPRAIEQLFELVMDAIEQRMNKGGEQS